jgi:hypothetical protein
MPLALPDLQIRMLAMAVGPIPYADRTAFALDLAEALRAHTAISNAELAGILSQLQCRYRG